MFIQRNSRCVSAVLAVIAASVAVFTAAADSLKVDFNGSTGQTMAGYQPYTAQNEVTNTFGARTYSAFGTSITVTPTWAGSPATNTAEEAQVRSLGAYSTNAADLPDVMIDWIGTDTRETPGNPMTLTIGGLPAGKYGWLSYHHDTQNQHGTFNVTVNDAAGSVLTSGLQISSTQTAPIVTNLAGVTKFATTITSDGTNPVTLVFNVTSPPNFDTAFFIINGFQLTNDTVLQAQAPLRRPISPNQPMWLVHIDSWNYPDPQKIIDLIPQDIRPYVVMNISLSISHDTNTPPRFQVAEYGYEIAKSWVRTCAENHMWCMVQQASGGMHQFSEFDLSVYEEFFRNYPNFLGFNFAEQFWGFDDPTDPVSAAWSDRIALFSNLLALSHRYGGYLVVSWCGNQWDPNINPIAMLKRNPGFAAACRSYTENFILCEKYTQQSYQSDMESVCLGAYLSGYSGQYGIRYDSTGWTDATGTNQNFTLATGGAPHLEHIMLTGETVIDAPELVWQQCFQGISDGATDSGYTMRRWQTFPQFDNVAVDIFRKVLDGTVRIPTRREVIDRTKVVIVNDINSGTSDDIYSSPTTLFEGLYRMDGDGDLSTNKTFFKKTGRYPTIPTVFQLNDTNATSFQVQVNKSAYSTRWPSLTAKTNEFNSLFPQEYTGDLYAGRYENGWVVYNPYKSNLTASASIPFKYNTCDHVDLTFSRYTSGVMKESSNSVSFYLCNYQVNLDNTLKTDTITIYGSTSAPSWSYVDRGSHQASIVTSNWSGGVFTLTVQHNGSLDITVNCAGTGTGRLTTYTPATLIAPSQPMDYPGPHQYEGECFDYKNIGGITTSGYSGNIRNYTGQGYLNFGTSSSAAVRDTVMVLKGGTYNLKTKYTVTAADVTTIDLYVNGVKVATPTFTQATALSNWAINQQTIALNAGANTVEFKANAAAPSSVYFDNIVVAPTGIGNGIVVQENKPGFSNVDGTIDSTYAGYTGDGYASTVNTNGASVYWNLNFDASSIKGFTFRYAGTNDSVADLVVNGTNVASNIQFPSTGAWTNWDLVSVYTYVPSGAGTVRLRSTSGNGLPHIDYLEVFGGWAGAQPPMGLTAAAVSPSQINLSWFASTNATSYNIKRSTTSGGPYSVVATGITATNFSDTGLAGGTTYHYVVSTTSAAGEGSDSGAASATTPSPTLSPIADSYVESFSPTVNFGTSTNMLVKNNISGSTAIRNAYLLFDVHGLANVSSATLTLMPNRVDDPTVKVYYGIAPTNWTEAGITWNNQPANSGINFATNTIAAGVPTVIDVTSAVTSQATNGGFLSIRITQVTNTLNSLVQFCSREHPTNSWRPVLQYVVPVNTAPGLAAINNRTIGAGMALAITNVASDAEAPPQILTFSLPAAPTNAVINTNTGVLTWRPLVNQANSTNLFTVMVSDNGTPSLSATRSFTVIVTNLLSPQISTVSANGGQIALQVNGASGPDYQVQASSNLVDWSAVLTTNSPAMPFVWTSGITNGPPINFFRVQAGPPF